MQHMTGCPPHESFAADLVSSPGTRVPRGQGHVVFASRMQIPALSLEIRRFLFLNEPTGSRHSQMCL